MTAPEQPPARPTIGLRVDQPVMDYLDDLAEQEGVLTKTGRPNRSAMLRLLLTRGRRTWVAGWRP